MFFMPFHLLKTGNKDGAVRALSAGLRFSHDVGNGGSFFCDANRKRPAHESPQGRRRRAALRTAIRQPAITTANGCLARLGEDLDWPIAAKRDLEAPRGDYAGTRKRPQL